MTVLDLHLNHMAPGPVIRQRLVELLEDVEIGDRRALDESIYNENDQSAPAPANQAVFVMFGGEFHATDSGSGRGLDHLWLSFIRQRVDYDGWEDEYGTLRAKLICALSGWQPGNDVTDLHLVSELSFVDQTPGMITDRIAWRLSQINFSYSLT